MSKLVTPKTFMVGATVLDLRGLIQYLEHTKQTQFIDSVNEAVDAGVNPGEVLCSFYAKLCYASLTIGRNKNLTRTRDIATNVQATLEAGHGSVFEHCWLNFVTTDCSRVFTHELVRHRVGTAFSQTSGRYVRADNIQLVFDPILEPVKADMIDLVELIEQRYARMASKLGLTDPGLSFDRKKKLTSALRRILPDGRANEIGWSVNLRALRHLVQLRTSHSAEWEIRLVFGEVFKLAQDKYPLMFADAKVRMIDGLVEVYGMKQQPYEVNVESLKS